MIKKLINKYKEMPKIVKATIWFSLITLIQKGVSALTTPIFARLMSVEQYGIYSLYVSWYTIFNIISTFNITLGLFNSLLVKNEEKQNEIASAVIGFEFFTTLITMPIVLIIVSIIGNLNGLSFDLFLLMFLEILFNIPIMIWIALKKFNVDYKKGFIVAVSELLFITALSVLSVVFFENDVYARVLSIIIVYFIYGSILFISILRKSKKIVDFKLWKIIFTKGAPLIFYFLTQALLSQSDKIMIDIFIGEAQTAIYSLAHQLSWLMYIAITAIDSTFIPWFYRRIKNGNIEKISIVIRYFLIMLGIIILIVSLLSPELIRLYGGYEYLEGSTLVPILSSSILILFVSNLFVKTQIYFEKNHYTVLVSTIGGICNILLNILLINVWGIFGAAVATLISYFIICFLHFIITSHVLKKNNMSIFKLFNIKIIFILLILYILFNCLSLLIFDYFVIRIILVCLVLFGAIIMIKKIANFFTKGEKDNG